MKKIVIIITLIVIVGLVLLGIVGGVVWYYWNATYPEVSDNGTCGGIAGLTCPENYVCYYPESADYPDATGQCIPEYVDRGDVSTDTGVRNLLR